MYSFPQAVERGFAKAFDFRSRAARSEYWFWVLFVFLVNFAAGFLDMALWGMEQGPLRLVVTLALLVPGLAYAVRRFHDLGRTGWWILLNLLPILGQLVVIIWFIFPGDEEENAYGPNPLTEGEPA